MLQQRLAECRKEQGTLIKRHRNLRGAFSNGITGIEQPGDDPESEIFKKKFNELKRLKQRHRFY